jgi:hypothetical protein
MQFGDKPIPNINIEVLNYFVVPRGIDLLRTAPADFLVAIKSGDS